MDMGRAYQKSVKDYLPHADVVLDRFHVMQNYSRAIANQRRMEFRKADYLGKKLIKGSKFLLLKNADKLNEKQISKLKKGGKIFRIGGRKDGHWEVKTED